MKYIFAFLVMLISNNVFALDLNDKTNDSIDKVIVRNVDVTGDGQPDTISLHIKAKSFNSPFAWTLTISSGSHVLESYSRDDSNIDNFFGDKQFYIKGNDYLQAKQTWYFSELIDSIIVQKSSYALEGILDKKQSNTLYAVGGNFLSKCCGIKGRKAENILSSIEQHLRNGKAIVICMPMTPVQSSNIIKVFSPEIGLFVPVYEE